MIEIDISPEAVDRMAGVLDEDGRHLEAAMGAGDPDYTNWCRQQRYAASMLRDQAARIKVLGARLHNLFVAIRAVKADPRNENGTQDVLDEAYEEARAALGPGA